MLGKIGASLKDKLKNVEWGEYRLGELFGIKTAKGFDEGKLNIISKKRDHLIEFIGRTRIDNGVKGYIERMEINPNNKDVISISQVGTITAQMRKSLWYASQNIFILEPPQERTKIVSLFVTSAINKALNCFSDGYSYYPTLESLNNLSIKLPVKNGKIDYDFMGEYVFEQEQDCIKKLLAYLKERGLEDYVLTDKEQEAINNYENLTFDDYDITEIFDIKNTRNILSSDIVENSGATPYLCASAENNGVSSYISYNEKLKDKGDCIFIGGKTFVVTYQEDDFYSNDSHNLALYLKNYDKTRLNQLYFTTCIEKSLSHKYSWGNSVSNAKIKSDLIALPTKNGKVDIETMDIFISAIQKLVIKDVVLFVNKKLKK